MRLFKPWALYIWAIIIAVILWLQVHGEGEGTLSLDVPIQLQGLPEHMVIVNNLPSNVKITVQGLQARLKTLQGQDIFMPLNVSDLLEPSVIQRSFNLDDVHLPTGLKIEKVQPDHLELQIDRIVTRTVSVQPNFDLPDEWEVQMVSVTPSMVHIQGPEVWLESLTSVDTLPLKPHLKQGAFELQSDIIVPADKSVHLQEDEASFKIKGILSKKKILLLTPKQVIQPLAPPITTSPPVQEPYSEPIMDSYSLPTAKKMILDSYSINPSEQLPNHTNEETP
ncbi:MAG: CdaR family protein [Mariprofundaceae bacterium]|nr:CdaR family protein [Mariprofundaceae bacterium]